MLVQPWQAVRFDRQTFVLDRSDLLFDAQYEIDHLHLVLIAYELDQIRSAQFFDVQRLYLSADFSES